MQQNMTGQNIIIKEPSSNLRALGRNALAGKWKLVIITVILYELCLQIPPAILNAIFGVKADIYSPQPGFNVDLYSSVYNSMPSISPLSSLYVFLVTGAFTLGITIFFLAVFRRQKTESTDIFLGFEHFGKALGLSLFQGLFVVLWSLLFLIPGIIAAIRYSQAFFILADDPSKGIRQCMNESKQMMKGNKGKYFCLTLSFFGWVILAAIPGSLIEGIIISLYAPAVIQGLATIVSSLLIVPVTAYIFSTQAGFYEILAGHLIKETEPAPVSPEAVSAIVETSGSPEAVSAIVETPVFTEAAAADAETPEENDAANELEENVDKENGENEEECSIPKEL